MTEDIDSLKASAEAVKEVAKTTGKAIVLGERIGAFMARCQVPADCKRAF